MTQDDSSRVYEVRSLEVAAELPRYHDWLMRSFRPHLRGRVIEVGAGIGTVAADYVGSVQSALLVEPANNLHERLAARFAANANVKTACATLEEVCAGKVVGVRAEAGTFDTAIMVNVLEHIEDDGGVLRQLEALLQPAGKLLIFVPAVPFLFGALDRRVGHVRRYTRSTLLDVVRRSGFEVEELRYFDLLGMVPWFITGRVLRQATVGTGSAQFYDQFIVPLCQAVDVITQRPLGKNLICVARKHGARA